MGYCGSQRRISHDANQPRLSLSFVTRAWCLKEIITKMTSLSQNSPGSSPGHHLDFWKGSSPPEHCYPWDAGVFRECSVAAD